MSRLDNRAYYDDFAGWYENERHLPYHKMLDDLEVELVERYATGKVTLEVGCGTGLILHRVERFARSASGIDLSGGMLAKAAARGLHVAQASATELPIATASVDVAYSFKVLAHIPDIAGAMREMARVVRPGGWVLAEFYNTRSLRYLVKRLKRSGSRVLGCAAALDEAWWLEARGVDAIVVQGNEAGGHRGMFLTSDLPTQVGTFALLP